MKIKIFPLFYFIFFIGILSCGKDTSMNKNRGMIQLMSVKVGTSTLSVSGTINNVPNDQPILIAFTSAVDTNSIIKVVTLQNSTGASVSYTCSAINNTTTLTLTPNSFLQYSTDYT